MLGLATPLWLLGLASLALPLAIHFWSRRPSRVAKVGSIRLLRSAPPATTRSLRLQDPWLMLLRMTILALIVLLLAGPSLERRRVESPVTWALVAPGSGARGGGLRARLDSLAATGAEIRLLAAGFPPAGETDADPEANYWALLREADRAVPPGSHLVVLAPLDRGRLRGTRPTLASSVTWIPTPAPPVPPNPLAPERRVAIFAAPTRDEDARYLLAGLRAVGLADGARLSVQRLPLRDTASVSADWIAWLAPAPAPGRLEFLAAGGATLLTEAADPRAQAAEGRIVFLERRSAAKLHRRPPDLAPGAPLWTDEAGRPLLTVEAVGRGHRLRLTTRLHPSWTDLVVRPEMPLELARLLHPPAREASVPVALSQAAPHTREAAGGPSRPPIDLHWPLWTVILLTVALERRLALGRRPNAP